MRLGGRAVAFLGILGGIHGLLGHRAAAGAILRELEERQRVGYVSGCWLAAAYAWSGRMDDAFACLDRAVEERDANLLYLTAAPRHSGLQDDPRFPGILERVGLRDPLRSG